MDASLSKFALYALVPMFCSYGALYLFVRRFRAVEKRNPLRKRLLRSPGESLLTQLDDTTWDLCAYVSLVPLLPILGYALYASQVAFSERAATLFFVAMIAAFVVGGEVAAIWNIAKQLNLRRRLSLGYDAELAVGQELNKLGRDGFYVFHDIPADGFNVDHVVVGPEGVFAIETKGRSKALRVDQKNAHVVAYDGTSLVFPTGKDTTALQQATRQARWLSEWLTGAVGAPVAVQPAIVLPGWFIKRTSGSGIPVLALEKLSHFVAKLRTTQSLAPDLVQRVAFQLEQRCRDVAPRAYSKDKIVFAR